MTPPSPIPPVRKRGRPRVYSSTAQKQASNVAQRRRKRQSYLTNLGSFYEAGNPVTKQFIRHDQGNTCLKSGDELTFFVYPKYNGQKCTLRSHHVFTNGIYPLIGYTISCTCYDGPCVPWLSKKWCLCCCVAGPQRPPYPSSILYTINTFFNT
ncbi:hypothetical protein BDV33DRAFT_90219 [Aspergillus novoparasiticus]|uniref:Uncharacterized protein n=1 Tax=Aspergillus novoparasiticus TaxID=986946 RepID=A0A5N6E842_9EURO|nr:hypothetical protein BDV33DRAFT_90219 [Aspergillus novoparasiticus]